MESSSGVTQTRAWRLYSGALVALFLACSLASFAGGLWWTACIFFMVASVLAATEFYLYVQRRKNGCNLRRMNRIEVGRAQVVALAALALCVLALGVGFVFGSVFR